MSGQWVPTSKQCFLWFDFPNFVDGLHNWSLYKKGLVQQEEAKSCYTRALELTLGSPKCVDEERSGLRASCTKLSSKHRSNQ